MRAQNRITAYWSGRACAYDVHQQRPDRLAENTKAWAGIWAAALPSGPWTSSTPAPEPARSR